MKLLSELFYLIGVPINTVIGGAVIRTVLFNWCAACRQWLVKLLSELFYLIGVQLAGSDW